MRKFYFIVEKGVAMLHQLSWSHYLEILKIDEELKSKFYINETINSKCGIRELQRQKDSLLYERLSLSADKGNVINIIIIYKNMNILINKLHNKNEI